MFMVGLVVQELNKKLKRFSALLVQSLVEIYHEIYCIYLNHVVHKIKTLPHL